MFLGEGWRSLRIHTRGGAPSAGRPHCCRQKEVRASAHDTSRRRQSQRWSQKGRSSDLISFFLDETVSFHFLKFKGVKKKKRCDFLPQFEHACLSSEEPQVRKKKKEKNRIIEESISGLHRPRPRPPWMRTAEGAFLGIITSICSSCVCLFKKLSSARLSCFSICFLNHNNQINVRWIITTNIHFHIDESNLNFARHEIREEP
jgi:hypothetical protein